MNDGGKREFFSRYFCVQGYSVRRYLRSEALRVKNRWVGKDSSVTGRYGSIEERRPAGSSPESSETARHVREVHHGNVQETCIEVGFQRQVSRYFEVWKISMIEACKRAWERRSGHAPEVCISWAHSHSAGTSPGSNQGFLFVGKPCFKSARTCSLRSRPLRYIEVQ